VFYRQRRLGNKTVNLLYYFNANTTIATT